jgi:uncharacterized protein YkwD
MHTLRRAVLIGVACLALLPAGALAGPKQDALIAHLNFARGLSGLKPLTIAPQLNRSASNFARWLMATQTFGHSGTIKAGGGFRTLGEALRFHVGDNPRYAATVQAWLASPSHRALVLSRRFTHAGAGLAQGRFKGRLSTIWVLHLGAR